MSLLSLVFRTVGAWGAGKGSDLTPAEVDGNFFDIQTEVNNLINNPVQPAQIESAVITDTDQLTFTLSNATVLDPVTIPVAGIAFKGEWQPSFDYLARDMFTATDETTGTRGLYFTNRDFESGIAFDPTLGTGIGDASPYASFIMPIADRVRVGWFWPGKPGDGIPLDALASSDTALMFSFLTTDEFYIDDDFGASISKLRGPSTADMVFDVQRNNVPFGTLSFAAGDADGVFAFTGSADFEQFEVGDTLELAVPTGGVDATAYGLSATIIGKLGNLDSGSSS